MKLILVDPKQALCKAWKEEFQNLPNVEIVQGYFERLAEFDCMVSAANSFGMMDGGVDLAIVNFFGKRVMENVQAAILRNYLGEQPVGTSMIIETGHPHHPFIAHTPTMRVPMPIAHTDHVYSAMWAMLLAVHYHNQTSSRKINVIACPGLGTTTGKVPYAEAAHQMAIAYKNFLYPPKFIDWIVITRRAKPIKTYQVGMEYHAAQKRILQGE